ncbi:MAG: hypothetical protein JW808_11440, partial [Victivallales bacterium]|nr:hypothetical protein [Victivallales bacterium]
MSHEPISKPPVGTRPVIAFAALVLCMGPCSFGQTQAIDNGKLWLANQQASDGSFSSGNKKLPDTSEAFHALWYLNHSGQVLNKALNWVKTQPDNGNAANISWKINTLAHSTADTSSLVAALLSLQNTDGGFAIAKDYKSTPLATVKALRALIEVKSQNTTAISKAISYLANTQKSHGGWTLQQQSTNDLESSDLFITAWVVALVRQYQVDNNYHPTNVSSMVSKASLYLEALQQTDYSWGDNERLSSTALALSALIRTTRPQSLGHAVSWLEARQAADDSFGNDIYKTALVLKALRDWSISPVPQPPDLKIDAADISFAPDNSSTTDQIQITAIIHNAGESPASNVQVQFYLGSPSAGGAAVGQRFVLPMIGPALSGKVTLGLYLPAGTHDIYAVADPDHIIIEKDENNNSASAQIIVAPGETTPGDFEILPEDLTFSNDNPTDADIITITVKVTNVGGSTADALIVALYDGDPANGGTQLGDDIVFPKLTAQSTATVSLRTMLAEGTHTVFAVADPHNTIVEALENNNSASRQITVTETPTSPADLVVTSSDISFSNTSPVATDLITISALIKNQGGRTAQDVKVRFYSNDPQQGGTQIAADLTLSGIYPGGQGRAELQTALPQGKHNIYVVVDPANTINESDKLNNTAFKEITVKPAPLPDLIIEVNDITVAGNQFHSGDKVTFTVNVHNIGPGVANEARVRIYEGNPASGGFPASKDTIITFLPGETQNLTFNWCAKVGDSNIFFVADPDNILPEENEYNNSASISMHVLPYQGLPPVSDPEIQAAIDRGVEWLRLNQIPYYDWYTGEKFGYWSAYSYPGGQALVMLALFHSGLDETDPTIVQGMKFFDFFDNMYGGKYHWWGDSTTYHVSLGLQMYHAIGNKTEHFEMLQLLHGQMLQVKYNSSDGMFSYGDMSNTQYGYLSLYAAQQWGLDISPAIHAKGVEFITNSQRNGGWGYWYGDAPYGAMTAAGTMIARMLLPNQSQVVQDGIKWLDDHYTINSNYYYLYSLERAMSIPTLIPKIGEHDWYQDGAAHLLSVQSPAGYWSGGGYPGSGPVLDTAFALLFLQRAVPEVSHPDLIVENITFSEDSPIQGDIITITATVRNAEYKNISTPFKVIFYDGDPGIGGQQIGADQVIASLDGEASATVSVTWTIPTAETHTIYVVTDAFNDVAEKNEDNNIGTAELAVLTNQGFDITVTTDRQLYNPDETVTADISVTNVGQVAAGGNVPVLIKDKTGNTIATLAPEYFEELAAGAALTFSRTWKVLAGTPSGDYRAEAAVVQDGQKKAADYAQFSVESVFGISAKVATDQARYNAHADVSIVSKAVSETPNFIYSDLKVKITVADAADTEFFSNMYTVKELQPQRLDQQKIVWNTGTSAPGAYSVTETIFESDGTTPLASSNAVFTIISSLESGGFRGKISVAPQTVEGPGEFDIIYEITN